MERVLKSLNETEKKCLIFKVLERCKSVLVHKPSRSQALHVTKSKSWPRIAPEGCVTVYVGSNKERFVIRTESVNHPLFKELLDEADNMYGHAHEGPIELPCDVDRFDRVLWEIDDHGEDVMKSPLCSLPASPIRGFSKGYAGYRALTRSRRVVTGRI